MYTCKERVCGMNGRGMDNKDKDDARCTPGKRWLKLVVGG